MWSSSGGAGLDLRHLYLQDVDVVTNVPIRSPATAQSSDGSPGTSGSAVGWGGQPLADSGAQRIAYFGRNRNKVTQQRHRPTLSSSRTELPGTVAGLQQPAPWASVPVRSPADVMSVEELVQFMKRLSKAEAIPERVLLALHHLDSRAVALLLKDLARAGHEARAFELFDCLRRLPDRHLLRHLCDVFTYTATISLCSSPQHVDTAMELFSEMRARGVERNVHTFTALMNVCIKCGKLPAALEVFHSMRAEGCTPNVVTFNTLIDVHGKLGQWDRAVEVISMMRAEGVPPALRTFNTLIIACNMCNQPREALAIYQQLQDSGFEANSTTYNALISAYGKLGQLDRVLEVYKDMVWRGLDRSVITYSSLISACEKAGSWQTALQLFDEMQKDGCSPNTVTYNSLITACGQGAQWQKAQEVFKRMPSSGCTPDVVTYTALISALERGGQWLLALETFQQMVASGCKPDAIVYNAIIDALWQTGVVWAQAKAQELFAMAVKQGYFKNEQLPANGNRWELNLHALTAGVAMLSLHNWLQAIQHKVLSRGEASLPPLLVIVTDAGHASKEQGNFIIKEAVNTMMSFWGAPFRAVQDRTYLGVLEATSSQIAQWIRTDSFSAQMAALFPSSAAEAAASGQLVNQREVAALTQCGEAFDAVKRFEASHNLALQNMSGQYLQQRTQLISSLLDRGNKLGLKDEVIHDGILLLDRAASTSTEMPADLQPLVAAAALHLSIAQSANTNGPYTPAAVAEVCGVDATALVDMTWQLRQLLKDDVMAISTMRCLKVYLERTGYRHLNEQGVYIMAGLPIMLAVEALFDMSLLNCRPSVVAAAILYAERRQRGAVPFWPSMLAKLTGYEDLTTPELACAVRTAQKLCRAVLYTQIYKQQSTNLGQQIKQQQQQQIGLVGLPVCSSAVPAAAGVLSRAVSGCSTGSTSSNFCTSSSLAVFTGSADAAAGQPAVAVSAAGVPGLVSVSSGPFVASRTLSGAVSASSCQVTALSGSLVPMGASGVIGIATMPVVSTPQPQVDYTLLAEMQLQQVQQQKQKQQQQLQQQQFQQQQLIQRQKQLQQQVQAQQQQQQMQQQYFLQQHLQQQQLVQQQQGSVIAVPAGKFITNNSSIVTLAPDNGSLACTPAPTAVLNAGLPAAFAHTAALTTAAGAAAVVEADPRLSNIAYSLAMLGLNGTGDGPPLTVTLSG